MNSTIDLITKLSSQAKPIKPMLNPKQWIFRLLLILGIYGIATQTFLGLRPDLFMQFTRPLFVVEIILMLSLLITSIIAAVLNIYPDLYQKSFWLKIPYVVFLLILGFFISQIFMPISGLAVIPTGIFHKVECTICIMFVAVIPALLIFTILKKGATIKPLQAGSFTVLAASSLGYLILRFSEANDTISHLLIWHYLPMFCFAAFGALIGKFLLKW